MRHSSTCITLNHPLFIDNRRYENDGLGRIEVSGQISREVLDMGSNNSNSSMLVGLLVGAAAGTIAALMLAPTTGKIVNAAKSRLKRTPAAASNPSDS